MKNELVRALARLASLPYQQRYIIGGTVDTYGLLEELLEDDTCPSRVVGVQASRSSSGR
jgi:hypothetical protein